jgi:hypothetical protein
MSIPPPGGTKSRPMVGLIEKIAHFRIGNDCASPVTPFCPPRKVLAVYMLAAEHQHLTGIPDPLNPNVNDQSSEG